LLVPVNIPRFYVPPGPLNDRLRKSQVQGEATLHVQVTWQRKMAVNLYAYIAPRVSQIEGWTLKAPPAALMFSVPMDSSSRVPALSRGAAKAVQPVGGLVWLRVFARQSVDRPVVVFFSSADSIQFLGTRTMLLAMAESPLHWHDDIADYD